MKLSLLYPVIIISRRNTISSKKTTYHIDVPFGFYLYISLRLIHHQQTACQGPHCCHSLKI